MELSEFLLSQNLNDKSIENLDLKFCVYLTYNLTNQKYYVGYSKSPQNIIEQKYRGSGKHLWYALKKYGWNSFHTIILKRFETSEEAFEYERNIVNEDFVKNSWTYNLKIGGKGGWLNSKEILDKRISSMKANRKAGLTYLKNALVDDPERNKKFRETLQKAHKNPKSRKRHSIAAKKNWESQEYRDKITGPPKGFIRIKKDGRFKQIYNETLLENYLNSGWVKGGIGFIKSQETIDKLKASHIKHWSKPENRQKRSETQKKWMSDSNKKQNMLNSRYETTRLIKEHKEKYFSDIYFLLNDLVFCEKMICLIKKYPQSLKGKRIQSQGWHYNIINAYRKLETSNHEKIQLLINYSKTFYSLAISKQLPTDEFINLQKQL